MEKFTPLRDKVKKKPSGKINFRLLLTSNVLFILGILSPLYIFAEAGKPVWLVVSATITLLLFLSEGILLVVLRHSGLWCLVKGFVAFHFGIGASFIISSVLREIMWCSNEFAGSAIVISLVISWIILILPIIGLLRKKQCKHTLSYDTVKDMDERPKDEQTQ